MAVVEHKRRTREKNVARKNGNGLVRRKKKEKDVPERQINENRVKK